MVRLLSDFALTTDLNNYLPLTLWPARLIQQLILPVNYQTKQSYALPVRFQAGALPSLRYHPKM